jgi:hypothetical protein
VAAGGVVHTTFLHPFYDETQASFVEAQNLHVGDILQTPTGTAEVTDLHLFHATTTTYDLTIANLHTFYVVAGQTAVLVHNCGNGPEGGEKFPNLEPENKAQDLAEAKAAGIAPAAPGTPEFDAYIASGEVKWGITPDGSLRVVPTDAPDGTEIFHSVINGDVTGEDDFLWAAGTADISGNAADGYEGTQLTNYSGHYQPSEGSVQLGRAAFGRYGINFADDAIGTI